jgi:hypothetical protein
MYQQAVLACFTFIRFPVLLASNDTLSNVIFVPRVVMM